MLKIDLYGVLKKADLGKKEIAEHLFPKNKFPVLALNRVVNGEAQLDSEQISKLAMLLGVEIQDLYVANWVPSHKKNKLVFNSDDFRAELDTKTWTTNIFHKDTLLHGVVLSKESVSLKEYINKLNSEINKIK